MAEAVPAYPKRPAFFAMKFIRLMVKAVVATELGQDVFTLLSVIASTEDSRRYKSPVVFHNGQLMPLLGIKTWARFDNARDAACEAGWLVHIPPGRGIRAPSSYWVTIPEGLEDIDDSPVDEGISEYSRGFADGRKSVIDSRVDHQLIVENAICNSVHYSTSDDQSMINPTIKRRSNDDQLIEHYIPIPIPVPSILSFSETDQVRNPRVPMPESQPNPNMAIHGIETPGGMLEYFPGDVEWTNAFVRWWNSLPGVNQLRIEDFDDSMRIQLNNRMNETNWFWKRAGATFPIHFPDSRKASITWFLKQGTVGKILAGDYQKTVDKPRAGHAAKPVAHSGINAVIERERRKAQNGNATTSDFGTIFESSRADGRGVPEADDGSAD